MKDRWKIVSKEVFASDPPCVIQQITYKNPDYPGAIIVSTKHSETHANGIGYWSWTDYIAKDETGQSRKFNRMMDAKKFFENKTR